MNRKIFSIAMVFYASFVSSSVLAQGPVSYPVHTQERAGNPQCIAPYAQPGVSKSDGLGYVGGGKLVGGGCSGPQEGTFGMDYVGFGWCRQRIFLNWFNDRPNQPPPGNYHTDGPKVPDVVAKNPIKMAKKSLAEHQK